LEKVDFINYPGEWWHWSYGDKYWAFIKGKDAIYNQIEEEKIKKI
jgi:D-alanyl-D-alanine dipeptidase